MNYAEIGYSIGYYGTPVFLLLILMHFILKFIRKRGDARRAKQRAKIEAENAAMYNEKVYREMERANLLKAKYTARTEMEKLEIVEEETEQEAVKDTAEHLEIIE